MHRLRPANQTPGQPGGWRPSWCYGAAGIGRALQLAAFATGDGTGQAAAEQALAACLRPAQLSRLTEPGLCHGLAGLYVTALRAAHDARSPDIAARLPAAAVLLAGKAGAAEGSVLLTGSAGVRLALESARNGTPRSGMGRMPADHLTEEPAFLPEESEERRWVHVSVTFPDREAAEQAMASAVAPLLDDVTTNWSYLRKHPCWRVRARDAPPGAVEDVLRRLQGEGAITGWQPGTYEPETFAFGGPAGMTITHDLFCADSHAILAYLRGPCGTGRREASLLAISAMLTAAGVDTFERGDVMGKVASLRPPAPTSADPNMTALISQLRTLLATPPVPALAQLSAEPWGLAFYTAGHRLAQAAGTGTLTRGLRAVLAHNVIFHWNRLGLPAKTQGILASAARDAWIPAS